MGERYISSSLTAILIATMPLFVALLSVRLSPGDKPTGLRLLGLVIGLCGVVALLGIDVAGRPDELLGAALVLLATLGYATAPIIVSRRLADLDPLGPVAASLTLSAIVLLPAVFVSPPHAITASALWAIAVLGVVCTAAGLVVFFQLIAEAGPSRAGVITYINPLVAVLLGVVGLDEHLGPMSVAGLVLILAGSWPHFSSCSSGRPSCSRFRRPSCQAGARHRSRRWPVSRESSRHSAACSCCSDCSPGRSPSSSRARWPSRISWATRHKAFGRCSIRGIPPSCSALFGSTSPPPGRGHGAWMPSGGSKPLDRSIVEGPLARAVWMLAWPTMLQNLIAGLQGVVDHALVGHFVGYAGNAAIGVGIQIFIVVIVFVISVFSGMGVLVARFAGANEPDKE